MKLAQMKLVSYVGRSRRGKRPASAFVPAARLVALREAVTGGLLDDGVHILHVVEGTEAAVDRFMAYVLLCGCFKNTRVVYEARHRTPLFKGLPLAYCFDEAWRQRIERLMAAAPVERIDLWNFCAGLAEHFQRFSAGPHAPGQDMPALPQPGIADARGALPWPVALGA